MKKPLFNKDQIQKIVLSGIGFVVLLYVYFNFFLGPLNKSREAAKAEIASYEAKLGTSKGEIAKAARLEQEAAAATARFAELKTVFPEGAPIAWFPPRMKSFFANQKIEKVTARLESSAPFKQPELAAWVRNNWAIDMPPTTFGTFGKAVAELENSEPLLGITKMTVHSIGTDPELQQMALSITTTMLKR